MPGSGHPGRPVVGEHDSFAAVRLERLVFEGPQMSWVDHLLGQSGDERQFNSAQKSR